MTKQYLHLANGLNGTSIFLGFHFQWYRRLHSICSSTDLRPIKNASLQRTKCARMWISLKRRFPLLGASVNERLGDEGADFVVTESRLGKVVSDKIDFSSVSSMQGA